MTLRDITMKIGLIAPVFLPLISGASLYCFELARALASYGHDVHVFTPLGGREDTAYTLHPVLSCYLPDDLSALLTPCVRIVVASNFKKIKFEIRNENI